MELSYSGTDVPATVVGLKEAEQSILPCFLQRNHSKTDIQNILQKFYLVIFGPNFLPVHHVSCLTFIVQLWVPTPCRVQTAPPAAPGQHPWRCSYAEGVAVSLLGLEA